MPTAPHGFESPIEFHAIGLTRGRRTWSPPTSGHRALAVAPFVNRTGLDVVGGLGGKDRILVSRQEVLDKLFDDALAAWKEILVLSETAHGEAEDVPADTAGTSDDPGTDAEARPSGLHAKDDRRRARLARDLVCGLGELDRGGVHRQQRRDDGICYWQERWRQRLLGGLDAVLGWAEDAGQGDAATPWGIGGDGGETLLDDLVRTASRDPGRLEPVRRLIDDLRKTDEGRRIVPDELFAVWTAVEEALAPEPRS